MENKKRPRFEMININNNISNGSMQGVASTTIPMGATTTVATIGGQSFILNNATTSLPANIYLSICDNSNDSEEYILDHSMLTHIKEEQITQPNESQNEHQKATAVANVPQYRIINQTTKPLSSTSLNYSIANNTAVNANNSLMSNSVNLPTGCEIYLVKEFYDLPKQVIAGSANNAINDCKTQANETAIKIMPRTAFSVPRNGNNTRTVNSNSSITINTNSPVTTTRHDSSNFSDNTAKKNLILDAYKKRDDKRRATHNEVERRRRDKINSWIFKLKEMLPNEVTPSGVNNSTINQNTTNRISAQQQAAATSTTTRTPPNDSKSQILIKACEYIKSMQEEINSLRECLTENENLRLQNQHLQDEIDNLRTKQQQKLRTANNSNIFLRRNDTNSSNNSNHDSDNSDDCEITLNSLNTTYANVQLFSPSPNQNSNQHELADLVGLTNSNVTTSTPITRSYAKRQLIITDYVD